MEAMNLTEKQWCELYQKLPQPEDFLFSLLPNLNVVFTAVEHGSLLTSRLLFYLLETNKVQLIPELVKAAKQMSSNVYDFMCRVYGAEQTIEFALTNNITCWYKYCSDEYLEQYQLWDALAQRRKTEPLVRHQQYDVLERYGYYTLLAECGQFERLIKAGKALALVFTAEGMAFLANAGLWEEFYQGWNESLCNGYTKDKVLNVLWDNNQQDLLFKKQEDEFLLGKGWVKPYLDEGFWGTLIAYGHVDKVDWEVYLAQVPVYSKDMVFQEAAKLKVWDFLAKHRQHGLLFNNKQFGWWLKSF